MVSSLIIILNLVLMVVCGAHSAALGKFGFDIHHRYSDTVKNVLSIDGFPEKDTLEYFTTMVHRDRLRGRRLAGDNDSTTHLTFAEGNLTVRFNELGYLHYAAVSVGTPSLTFLVALDTGSSLFWLPCECTECLRSYDANAGRIDFNMYSLNGSSTSTIVSCNSTMCGSQNECLTEQNVCAYHSSYRSRNTSSTGLLVEDVLHLTANDNQQAVIDAPITLGCGIIQTGIFLTTGAPNGLFGLGMEDISVPSILAKKGLTANSFSLCFGPKGVGRIVFGDEGSTDQGETPFVVDESHYYVSMSQVVIGEKVANLDLTAVIDSGTSFTMLEDNSYTIISENFDSQVEDPRHQNNSRMPFEYCYGLKSTTNGYESPKMPGISVTMEGGNQFNVTNPIIILEIEEVGYVYCLAVVKSANVSIIGQNFLSGYKMVFDREKMVLGWKESDCFNTENSETGSNMPPASPTSAPPPPPRAVTRQNSTQGSPPPIEVPDTTPQNGIDSPPSTPRVRLPGTNAAQSSSFTCKVLMVFLSVFSHYFVNLLS